MCEATARTRRVEFDSDYLAETAAAIAERICEDVVVEGSTVTLSGTTKDIGDALLELQLSGFDARPVQ